VVDPKRVLALAVRRGFSLVLNSDSHHAAQTIVSKVSILRVRYRIVVMLRGRAAQVQRSAALIGSEGSSYVAKVESS